MGTKLRYLIIGVTMIMLLLSLAFDAYTQKNVFVDYDNEMKRDSLLATGSDVQQVIVDTWFNAADITEYGVLNTGNVQLGVYTEMKSSVAGSDSLVLRGCSLTRKLIKKSADGARSWQTFVGDTVTIATIPVDTALNIYSLESLYTNFPMMDGYRLIAGENGSDADSLIFWHNYRHYKRP